MRLNPKSIVFKTGIIYILVTLLNILVFVLMIFENQLDLIVENAVLSAMHKGSSLRYRIDMILTQKNEISTVNINRILKEASTLDIRYITLFREDGEVFVSVADNRQVEKNEASLEELKITGVDTVAPPPRASQAFPGYRNACHSALRNWGLLNNFPVL